MTSSTSSYATRLPLWVLIGACLGLFVGLFFGDDAAVLHPIGATYVKLMEVVVFPYIIASLLHGLGRLSPETAWRLFRCSWLVYLAVWGITFLIIFLVSLAIPPVPPPSYIDATAPQQGIGLLDLLIPANPFFDLARNYVPAIVIFSIVYGVAIQRVKNKETFLSMLELVRDASITIWRWIVLLAPFGVFALFANTFGTVKLDQFADLAIYLITIFAGTLILAFWVLPSLIAAICPLSPRDVLRDLQAALVIAVVTSLSVAALPFIQQATEKLADRMGVHDENRGEIINTTLAVSYPLGQLGNFFIWLFVLFCAFYYRVPISDGNELALPFVSLLSGIGSPSSSIDAVDFLVSWLGLPPDATGLYAGMLSVTRYGQVLASVMGFAFITFLVTLIYYGKLQLRVPKLALSFLVSVAVLAAVTVGGRYFEDDVVDYKTPTYQTYQLEPDVTDGVTVIIEKEGDDDSTAGQSTSDDEAPAQETVLDRIQRTGELRIGYNPHVIPFSYLNENGDLVGFDIAYAHRLASDLNVKLRLVPFSWQSLEQDLQDRRFDMAASGIYVTDERLQNMTVSEPYYQSPIALIVRSDNVSNFLSRSAIQAQEDLVVGVFDDPILRPLVGLLFPDAAIKVVPNYRDLLDHPDIDAAIWTLEQAKAWAQPHPDFTAVVPNDLGGPFLIAYMMPEGAIQLQQFLNYWMTLQHANGFRDRMVSHWLDGKPEVKETPRWSIMRDVLGWGVD